MLNGKVVLVTGGTSGIGEATALHCAALGAHVVLTGRNTGRGAAVAERAQQAGGRARFLSGDVTDRAFADAAVADVVRQEGRLDVLVNNAGILFHGTALECTDEQWDATMATNVTGAFRMARAALRHMVPLRAGVIINVASDWSLVAAQKAIAYGVSKGAIAQLTRSLAIDHARDGVRVNAVCPGDTDTPMLDGLMGDCPRAEALARQGAAIPMGRVGDPREVARLIAFLASDACPFMTGALVPIDGGNSAA